MEASNREVSANIGMGVSAFLGLLTFAFGISLVIKGALYVSFVSSMLIAPSFIMVLVCLSQCVSLKVWLRIGIVFGAIYAAYAMLNYYMQLTVARVNDLGLEPGILAILVFKPGSAMFAQDMLGYAFLCLATLVSAPAFKGDRLEKAIRLAFSIHGAMFVIPLIFPLLSFSGGGGDDVGALANLFWCVVFLPITMLLFAYFRRERRRVIAS